VQKAYNLALPLTPQKKNRVETKPKVSEVQKEQIKAFIEENSKHRLIPWRKLPYYLDSFEQISDGAIIRAIHDLGYQRKPRGKRIRLTFSHKQQRLE